MGLVATDCCVYIRPADFFMDLKLAHAEIKASNWKETLLKQHLLRMSKRVNKGELLLRCWPWEKLSCAAAAAGCFGMRREDKGIYEKTWAVTLVPSSDAFYDDRTRVIKTA